MIRLTELERVGDVLRARLEGSLTPVALTVLKQALHDYRAAGLRTAVLEADGVVLVDRLAMREWQALVPAGPSVRLTTSRRSLHQLLASYGALVDYVHPPRGATTPLKEAPDRCSTHCPVLPLSLADDEPGASPTGTDRTNGQTTNLQEVAPC